MNIVKTLSIILLASAIMSSCNEDNCIESTWYEDADGDGLGNPDVSLLACEQPEDYVADNSGTDDYGSPVACNTSGEESQSINSEIEAMRQAMVDFRSFHCHLLCCPKHQCA